MGTSTQAALIEIEISHESGPLRQSHTIKETAMTMKHSFRSSSLSGVFAFSILLSSTVGFADGDDTKSLNNKPLVKTTHVYKTVGDVKVEADVYRPEGAEVRPVVVWIHGGNAPGWLADSLAF